MKHSGKQCTPYTGAAAHGVASKDADADRRVTSHTDTIRNAELPIKRRAFLFVWRGTLLPACPDSTPLTALQRALLDRGASGDAGGLSLS